MTERVKKSLHLLGVLVVIAVMSVIGSMCTLQYYNKGPAYEIIKVDKCEYIKFRNGQTIHKVDCSNPKHYTDLDPDMMNRG